MNDAPILPDDEPPSTPSMPTQWGGDPACLGRIDHYDLLRKLGGGGFGVVYLARDSVSGVEVALKTLHPLLKHNAEEMDLLREKFRLVHGLTHPNIAKALVIHLVREINIRDEAARAELKLSPGDSVMVMDYAPGVTLSMWRRQFPGGVVPFDLALEVGRQVAAALDYAHSERIVHRDIKPSNVMVETVAAEPRPLDHGQGAARSLIAPTLRVRILDFGLAAEIRSSMSRVSTESGDTSGTRPYMAPEQWLGRKQDGRTDQYALACVLYELLSGAPPFAGVFETGDPAIMANAVASQTPEEIENLAPAANAALLRALSKAPKDRFSSCTALVDALSSTPEHVEDTEVGAGAPGEPSSQAAQEADVLRRKVSLARRFAGTPESDRSDAAFAPFISDAETELAAAEDACKYGRFAAAAACLERLRASLDRLDHARTQRQADDKRAAREEAFHRQMEREAEERAEAERRARAAAAEIVPGTIRTVEIAPGVPMDFCWCPATTSEAWRKISGGDDFFWMGSPESEPGRDGDELRHRVKLTEGFWMGRTPVTQGQWLAIMGSNPSYHLDGKNWFGFGGKISPDRPVDSVSWHDCQDFLKKLNALPSAKASGLTFRLPKEAEWKMACRAGATGKYCRLADGTEITEETLGRVAWFGDNSNSQTHPVGEKEPNAWGLYDMHGNVWEWTETAVGENRVCRGGSWGNSARDCGSSDRGGDSPSNRYCYLGFRLCASGRAD